MRESHKIRANRQQLRVTNSAPGPGDFPLGSPKSRAAARAMNDRLKDSGVRWRLIMIGHPHEDCKGRWCHDTCGFVKGDLFVDEDGEVVKHWTPRETKVVRRDCIGNGPGTGPGGAYKTLCPDIESNEVERAQILPGSEVIDVEPKADDPAPVEEPNPVVPPTNQVVPPTVPIAPKPQVAGFVCLGRPRRFWNPGRT